MKRNERHEAQDRALDALINAMSLLSDEGKADQAKYVEDLATRLAKSWGISSKSGLPNL